jgi:hypothetical protein
MDFLQKYFNGVFLLSLPTNAQKRTKTGRWVGLGFGVQKHQKKTPHAQRPCQKVFTPKSVF